MMREVRWHIPSLLLCFLVSTVSAQNGMVKCGGSWQQLGDKCFLAVAGSRESWSGARGNCQNRAGADLAVIPDNATNSFLETMLSGVTTTFWIGLHDLPKENEFRWVDGETLAEKNFKKWAPNNPNDGGFFFFNEDCVSFDPVIGKWKDDSCQSRKDFICERNVTSIPKCDESNGWRSYNGKCYQFFNDRQSWQTAEDTCGFYQGGHLAFIQSDQDQTFLDNMQVTHGNSYWFGLQDGANKGDFQWSDKSAFDGKIYENWVNKNQPATTWFGNGGDCGSVTTSGVWTIKKCTDTSRYVCAIPEGACAPGWHLINGQCFQLNSKTAMTWTDAKLFCEAQLAYLTSIKSDAENNLIKSFLADLVPQGINEVHIGVSDLENDGTFVWIDGSSPSTTYTNWVDGQPPDTPNSLKECGYINTDSQDAKWMAGDCFKLGAFVCKTKAGAKVTSVPTNPITDHCDPGWALHNGNCYKITRDNKNWDDANAACKASTAELVSIHSDDAQSFMSVRIDLVRQRVWIGLNDKATESTFVWTDASPLDYKNWAPPGNPGTEDCVSMEGHTTNYGLWTARRCSETNYYACMKKSIQGVGPSAPPLPTVVYNTRCGTGWEYDKKSNKCFLFKPFDYLNWFEARYKCRQLGGDLISLTSNDDLFYASYRLKTTGGGESWIGCNDLGREGGWVWSDSKPFSLLNWASGQPDNWLGGTPIGEHCCNIYNDKGTWNDQFCENKIGYSCNKDDTIFRYFITYSEKKMNEPVDKTLTNVWPKQCAEACLSSPTNVLFCRSFDYERSTRTCYLRKIDKSAVGLVPTFDTQHFDHYERDVLVSPPPQPTPIAANKHCPKDWGLYHQYCYYVNLNKFDFAGAEAECKKLGAELTSIQDVNTNNFIRALIQEKLPSENRFWIGLNDKKQEMLYEWSNGEEVTYTNWNAHEPNDRFGEDCTEIYLDSGFWNDVPCQGSKFNSVCRALVSVNPAQPPDTTCGSGLQNTWNYAWADRCYQINKFETTWVDANNRCTQEAGAHLVIIETKMELAYLSALLGLQDGNDFYIALSDFVLKGYYQWEDDSTITFTNWAEGQPDNGQGHCVTMNSGDDAGYWTDRDCSKKYRYICEKARQGYPTIGPRVVPTPTPPSDQGCSTGWTGYGLRCFKSFELADADAVNWDNANLACSKLGGSLASFHHPDEEKYLINTFSTNTNKRFWIGLNDQRYEGGYAWSDGTQVEYTNWATGEPNDSGGKEECVETDFNGGKWNDESCWSKKSYICSIPKGQAVITPPPPTTIAGAPCSEVNWFHLAPYCYYFSSRQDGLKDWYGARDFCHSQSAHLVSIHSKAERNFVNQRLETLAGSYWSGLRSNLSHPGEHTWSDGTLLDIKNWFPFQPDTQNGEELCVELSNSPILPFTKGQWQDANCGLESRFVCKKNVDGSNTPTHQPTPAPDGNCLQGWNQYSDKRCYKIMGLGESGDPKLNWKDARNDCIAKGAHFASIHDDNVQTYVTASMIDADDDVWIGMSALASGSKYVWTDSSTLDYVNWASDQGDSTGFLPGNGNDCIGMLYDEQETGKWKDEDCNTKHSYLCKMDPDQANTNTSVPTPCNKATLASKGYTQYGDDLCFKLYVDKFRSFDNAKALCAADGDNVTLASILNGFEQAKLQSMLIDEDKADDIWIGMYDDPEIGVFNWLDGWPLHYTNWGWSDPRGLECAVMKESGLLYEPGEWSNIACYTIIGYYTACKHSTVSPPPPEPTVAGYCESGWTAFGVSCYKVGSDIFATASFGEAIYDCDRNYGGALVATVGSKAENTFLKGLGQKEFGVNQLLIGIDRTNSGGWQWVDGSPLTFVNWADPNAQSNGKNCAELRFTDGKWYHVSCTAKSHYVCEKPKIQSFTTQPPVEVKPCTSGDPSWKMKEPFCYYFSSIYRSWHDAEVWCNEKGGYLASIHSQDENDYIANLVSITGYTYAASWIGLNKLYDGSGLDDYRWSDKTNPGDYTKAWAPGEPNDYQGAQKCVQMNGGLWEDNNCGATQSFICKRKSDSTAPIIKPPPPSATGNCQQGWHKLGTGCYQINGDEANFMTWQKAREQCQTHSRGELASIHSQGVQSLLASLLKSSSGHMWIGLRLGTGGWFGYHWVDQSNIDYAHWARDTPTHYYDEDFCVVMVNDPALPGRWRDLDCTEKHGYLCYQPLNSNLPPIETERGNCSTEGYLPYFDDCFKMNVTRLSFDDAKQACEDEGAALATVIDGYAEAFIIAEMLYANNVQIAWIGFKAANSTGVYGWVDEWPDTYTNLSPYWSSEYGNCVFVSDYAYWYNTLCQHQLPFICRTTSASFVLPTYAPAIPGSCPKDWLPYGDSCYMFDTNEYATWYEAHYRCSQNFEQSGLLSIHNKAENAFVLRSNAATNGKYRSLWLDLSRNETAVGQFEFLWNDGHVFDYNNWKLGEPSPKGSSSDCAVIKPNAYGKWNTEYCYTYIDYACKKPKVPWPEGGCEKDWYRMNNWCYGAFGAFEPQSKTWVDAEKDCNDKGGNLATVYSQSVQSLLEAMMFEMKQTNAWIGLNKRSTDFYEWVDGTPYGFSHWKDGVQDNTDKDKKCVLIENHPSEPGLWKSQLCGNLDSENRLPKEGYFCQKPTDSTLPPYPTGDTCSQPGYFKYSLSCFKVYNSADQLKTFQEAETQCEGDGGTLCSIPNGFHEAFAETLLFYYGIKDAWIGLKKGEDGNFAWLSGDSYPYKNWNGGKEGTSGDCVRITDRKNWETVPCDTKHNFICQIEAPPGTEGTDTTDNSAKPPTKSAQTGNGLTGGAIAGIIIAVLVIILLCLTIGYFLLRTRASKQPLSIDTDIKTPGFDNVMYSPDEDDVSFEKTASNA